MFRVELRDKEFNLLEILDNEFMDLSWSYSRIGGCGEFSFKLPRKLYEEKSISGDFNIRIYKRNDLTKAFDLWYQGLIENKTPNISGNSENINVSGHGYCVQLPRLYINKTYTSQEVSVIVKDILDTYIVPYTNITYTASDIENTSFTPTKLEFNTDVQGAIETCADIVGSREWGVDKDRKFFFKAKSSSLGFNFPLGGNITNFNEDLNFKEIINKIVVQGAQTGGTYYTQTYNDTTSQLKYNIRTKVLQNSSITTDDVASQFANSTFAEFNDVVRKASCSLVGYEARLEATVPIPLVTILAKEIYYGEKYYGTFLYSGRVNRSLNRINYSLSNNNALKISLDLNQLKPTIAEEISQLAYNLEQQRNASL
jgi:hypothetical protein